MIFEFTIVYQREDNTNIRNVLLGHLADVLTDNLNQFDADAIDRIRTRHGMTPTGISEHPCESVASSMPA